MFVERNTVAGNIVVEGHNTVGAFEPNARVGDSGRSLVVWLDAIGTVVEHTVGYLGNTEPVF